MIDGNLKFPGHKVWGHRKPWYARLLVSGWKRLNSENSLCILYKIKTFFSTQKQLLRFVWRHQIIYFCKCFEHTVPYQESNTSIIHCSVQYFRFPPEKRFHDHRTPSFPRRIETQFYTQRIFIVENVSHRYFSARHKTKATVHKRLPV